MPPNLEPGQPVPLLVALHGGTGSGTQFEQNSGFDQLADRYGFIVVYPDGVGIGRKGNALRTWNGGGCCGPAARQQVDDVGFIRQLVEQLHGVGHRRAETLREEILGVLHLEADLIVGQLGEVRVRVGVVP